MAQLLQAHDELERALAATKRRWTLRRVLGSAALAILLGTTVLYRSLRPSTEAPRYEVTSITRGDVVLRIRANGTVEPVLEVKVGAQVSGRVAEVFVDYNSPVKKGDVLAEIDQTLADAEVSQQKANLVAQQGQLASARSNMEAARLTLKRTKLMYQGSAATQMSLESAQAAYEVARSTVESAVGTLAATRARLDLAKTNLTNTKILSPIDGVVVARNVDPGAVVVANFQIETLFLIAKDLANMQIVAHIDEADVGELRAGMNVLATVDAYPGQTFSGRIRQIRYSAEVLQGVVTYPTVIDVPNPEGKLRPGMTASVTIVSRQAQNVPRIKNTALRFQPSHGVAAQPADGEPEHGSAHGTLWVLTGGELGKETTVPTSVQLGITDGTYTELVNASLPADARIATAEAAR